MKNSPFPTHEVESLRLQVRQLHESVAALETRLAAFESDESEPEDGADNWAIWPYCHVVSAWNSGRDGFHWFHKNVSKLKVTRRRRYRLQNDVPLGEMRLT